MFAANAAGAAQADEAGNTASSVVAEDGAERQNEEADKEEGEEGKDKDIEGRNKEGSDDKGAKG